MQTSPWKACKCSLRLDKNVPCTSTWGTLIERSAWLYKQVVRQILLLPRADRLRWGRAGMPCLAHDAEYKKLTPHAVDEDFPTAPKQCS